MENSPVKRPLKKPPTPLQNKPQRSARDEAAWSEVVVPSVSLTLGSEVFSFTLVSTLVRVSRVDCVRCIHLSCFSACLSIRLVSLGRILRVSTKWLVTAGSATAKMCKDSQSF